jgi:hypothetical protein
MAELCLESNNIVFEKPDDSVKHLRSLYVRGHIDGTPISRMSVDEGAAVNIMPYSLFKRLGKKYNELMT